MRFLSVAERELRAAARQRMTYRARWVTAFLFFALLLWLMWVFGGFRNQGVAPQIFRCYTVLTLIYCLIISAARTADCISAEKREGTLGLLFLTNLNSAEIVAGKLCSSALAAVFGLMAIFPMLALPLLMGGITFAWFGRVVLALLSGILFALTAGFVASVLSRRQFIAVALATGLTIGVAGGFMLGAAFANEFKSTRWISPFLAVFSPIYTLVAAENGRVFGRNFFWESVGTLGVLSAGGLALTTLALSRSWRDRPRTRNVFTQLSSAQFFRIGRWADRMEFNRRLLRINPMFWLAGRQRVSAPVFMLMALILTLITVYVAAPAFGKWMNSGTYSLVVGHLFSWLWTGLAIHGLVLYYAAMIASQRLAEDKQTGALELILSTPTTEKTIRRGLWLAFWRKMLFPGLLAVLVHCFFIWMVLVMASLDPPGQMPSGATLSEIFWSGLLDRPLRGRMLEWAFGFMLRIAVFSLPLLMLTWPTLAWVGRWLGLRLKHSGFAPLVSLALLIIPPIGLFTFGCIVAVKLWLYKFQDRQVLPLLMWIAIAIGVGHCIVLSIWASSMLRTQLRPVAMSRYQPLPLWRFRLPSLRLVLRVAGGAAAFVLVVVLLVMGYYGLNNWRSKRAWRAFNASLAQRGETLDVGRLMPKQVLDKENFALYPGLLSLVSSTNAQTKALFNRIGAFDMPADAYQASLILFDWTHQSNSVLVPFLNRNTRPSKTGAGKNRTADAGLLLQELEPQREMLRDLAAAAEHLPAFQTVTNTDARALFSPRREPALTLERLQLIYSVRACALIAAGRAGEAAKDVGTGLRLIKLAEQIPDARSMVRVQLMTCRSLQGVWDGLNEHGWKEEELAAIQRQLEGFNLLADYTNAVARVVVASIQLWSQVPDSVNAAYSLPQVQGTYLPSHWAMQPLNWWLDNCQQLYSVGHAAIEQVEVVNCRVNPINNWGDVNDLPLDAASQQLLQPWLWYNPHPSSLAFNQTSINQAVVACALERYRLRHGAYPDGLDKLVTEFLATIRHDAISGRRLIYKRADNTHFDLRGVGANGLDDSNKPVSDDWVWKYK